MEWLHDEVTPLTGPIQTLSLFLYNHYHNSASTGVTPGIDLGPATDQKSKWSSAFALDIHVQTFCPKDDTEANHILTVHETWSNKFHRIPGQFYAIPEEKLPKIQNLEDWALDTLLSHHSVAFVGGLRAALLTLARRYHESRKDLPLVSSFFISS